MYAYDTETTDLSKYEILLLRALSDDGPEADTALRLLRRKLRADKVDPHALRLFDRSETPFEAANRSMEFREQHLHSRIAELEQQLAVARRGKFDTVTPIPSETRPDNGRREAREAFDWSQYPDIELDLSRRFLAGESISKLAVDARNLTGADISLNQLTQRFFNGHPPKAMRVTQVHLGAPLTWEELWTIGRIVYGKSWIAKSFIGMGNIPPRKQGTDLTDIPMEVVDTLRTRAIAKMSDTLLATEKVLTMVAEASTGGVTRAALRKAGCDTRAISAALSSGEVVVINPDAIAKDQRLIHRTLAR